MKLISYLDYAFETTKTEVYYVVLSNKDELVSILNL